MPRLLPFACTLALLLGITWAAWQHRFRSHPSGVRWNLAVLRHQATPAAGVTWQGSGDATRLRLSASPNQRTMMALPLAGMPADAGLDFRLTLSAHGLALGKQCWDDGRVVLEWRSPHTGRGLASHMLGTAREDMVHRHFEGVATSPQPGALAVLHVEHLGSSGEFEVESLAAVAIREAAWWRYGRWLLAATWFAWATLAAGWHPGRKLLRPLAAATLWLAFAVALILPGPWFPYRPLAGSFVLGPPSARPSEAPPLLPPAAPPTVIQPRADAPAAVAAVPPAPAAASPDAPVAQPPLSSRLLAIKDRFPRLRAAFHALMFSATGFALLTLAGTRRGLLMAALLAIAKEASQVALGFGCDWLDLFDLATDAVGLGLAWLLWRWLGQRTGCLRLAAKPQVAAR